MLYGFDSDFEPFLQINYLLLIISIIFFYLENYRLFLSNNLIIKNQKDLVLELFYFFYC